MQFWAPFIQKPDPKIPPRIRLKSPKITLTARHFKGSLIFSLTVTLALSV